MAWPTVTSGQSMLASQYNALSAAIASWAGNVSANGYSLSYSGGGASNYATANASWNEFRLIAMAGSSQANDLWAFQYNQRASVGGSDSWTSVFTISVGGVLSFTGQITASAGLVVNNSFQANGGSLLSGNTILSGGNVSFSGTGVTFQPGVPVNFNGPTYSGTGGQEYYTTSNASWQEFRMGTSVGGSQAADQWNFWFNTRTSANGSDNWAGLISITAAGGIYIGGGYPIYITANSLLIAATTLTTFQGPANIVFGGNWQSYTPTAAGSGSMTISNVTVYAATYLRIGPILFFRVYLNLTTGGTASNIITISVPIASTVPASMIGVGYAWTPIFAYVTGTSLSCTAPNGGNWGLGSNTIIVSGSYQCA